MSRKGNMDEFNFNWIKHLQIEHPEWSFAQIADQTGWSKDVAARAGRSESFESYRELVKSLSSKDGDTVKRRKYNTRMTEQLFITIKNELAKGKTVSAISDKHKVCHSNVTAVRHSKTYEDYKSESKRSNGDDAKTVEKPMSATEWQRWYDSLILQMAKDASKARYELEQIHELMAFIVDQLK